MYISNKDLVNKYFVENGEYIYSLLVVVKKLINKYGKKLVNTIILSEIEKVYSDLVKIIILLKTLGKLNLADINQILYYLKEKTPNIPKEFKILVPESEKVEDVIKYLNDKFGSNLELKIKKVEELMLDVRGEGYIYSRGLGKDLKKLLDFNF